MDQTEAIQKLRAEHMRKMGIQEVKPKPPPAIQVEETPVPPPMNEQEVLSAMEEDPREGLRITVVPRQGYRPISIRAAQTKN